MREIVGDIWKFWERGHWIVVTTNGNRKSNGDAVMGKGIALEAARRCPKLPKLLGAEIKTFGGDQVFVFPDYRIVTFPTKKSWWSKSDLDLIENSAIHLASFLEDDMRVKAPVYLPHVGCQNGGLDWKDVKLILERYLDDRFVAVERPQ